jgi:uncharacterized membrane protein YdjX (TVP38/TMEM64 family)
MLLVYLSAWIGSVNGAMLVYYLSRKHGAERLEKQIAGRKRTRT